MGDYKPRSPRGMNQDMPPEPFMKRAALEVMACRKRIAALEEENKALVEENDTLRSKRLSYEESVRLKNEVATLRGTVQSLKAGTSVGRLRRENKIIKKHNYDLAKRYVDAMSKGVPPNLRLLLRSAYMAGWSDEEPDFYKFYKTITEDEQGDKVICGQGEGESLDSGV